MKECLYVSNLVSLLESTCLDMEAACDELTEIDAKSGDGDLGVSVKLGFEAVRRGLPELAGLDVGTLLMKSEWRSTPLAFRLARLITVFMRKSGQR